MTGHVMRRGDLVQAVGSGPAWKGMLLWGTVVKAGSATYTVEWGSGLSSRIAQGYAHVTLRGSDAAQEQTKAVQS